MGFYRTVIERYVGVLLLVGLAAILGLLGLGQLPVSFYPDFTVPVAIIVTSYPGAGPESVESEITKPLEQAVATLSGLEFIESISQEGSSRITVGFAYGVEAESKKKEVQEKVDMAKAQLPRGAGQPAVTTINQLLPPPVQLSVISQSRSLGELKQWVEDRLAPAIARLPGVAAAQVSGGTELVVRVEMDRRRLKETGLGASQLAQALGSGNIESPLGDVQGSRQSFVLRLAARYRSLEEIEDQPVAALPGRILRVKDLARVTLVEKERRSIVRFNGRESVGLLVRKPSGGNSVEVAGSVRDWLRRNKERLPADIEITIVNDESRVIGSALKDVALSGLCGGLLASAVIWLFLGSLANTLVVVLAVPTTLMIAFGLMRIFGLSLNTVSLGGLSLSIGLVVDGAVVVMENAFRRLKENSNNLARATVVASSVQEVGLAVSASTLTTIVVFLPLAFTQGLAKVLLGELALTVVFALTVSISLAVTLVPVLCYHLLNTEKSEGKYNRWFLRLLDRIKQLYLRILELALRKRGAAVAVFTFLLLLGLAISRFVDTGLLAETDPGEFQITVSYPVGTSLAYTDRRVSDLEQRLIKTPGVDRVFAIVGQDRFFGTSQPYFASINVYSDGRTPIRKLMEEARRMLAEMPGAATTVRMIDATAGVRQNDIDVNIYGDDLDTLRHLGQLLVKGLESRGAYINLTSNLASGFPAYTFVPDRQRLVAVGLTPSALAQTVRAWAAGQVATLFRRGDRDIEVELSYAGAEGLGRNDLENLPVNTPLAGVLPLKALGVWQEEVSPPQVVRLDQSRTVNVTGDLAPGVSSRRGRAELAAYLRSFPLPPGYRTELRGANRAIVQSFQTLGIALLLAVFLVYIVMGVQFNSLTLPLVIILSVPFSLTGFFGALFLGGQALNLSSFLSAIILSGVVVNNSILLLDFAVRRRRLGDGCHLAVLEAGRLRFRPILMTSLTTIFGALFLALDPWGGGQALKSLATAFIGGMSYSLAVSLILVPVVYTLFDDLLCRWGRNCLPARVDDDQ